MPPTPYAREIGTMWQIGVLTVLTRKLCTFWPVWVSSRSHSEAPFML